ncbi:MAG: hypothetical protein IKD04_04885 [Clostridia bacterium]|nr:hypothetical protein [Clostridia bacterium]
MAIGFRKSLFGFNCEDVTQYIEKTHKTFLSREKELNEKLSGIIDQLNLSKDEQKKLSAEKEELSKKLAEFTEKYDEIERLSENIGKLYLVAQANAQAIIENSENSARISNEEVSKNLCTIDEAHKSLHELRLNITKTSEDFVTEVDKLISSLDNTREQITANTDSAVAAKDEFDRVYSSIVE